MAKQTINGIEFDVPDSGMTGGEIKKVAGIAQDDTLYTVDKTGKHQVVEDSQRIQPGEGAGFGSVPRFTAA